MAEAIVGSTWGVFIGVSILLFGFGAFMTGQAMAENWRPMPQLLPYTILLAAGARFFTYALFDGTLLSLSGFVLTWVVLLAIAAAAYRATKARRMVVQYPWLYERSGLFTWREKAAP
jgi:ABC-type microcin C transport system permease subunit YejE